MPLDVLGIDASRASSAAMTGTEWYSSEIIRALSGLDERPTLRLYQREQAPVVDKRRVEVRAIERERFWTHVGLAATVRREAPDALFIPAHVIPPFHPPATVVTVHDLGYRYEPRGHTLRRRLELDLSTRWNAARAARIIVPSGQTKNDLSDVYGVEPDRIDVIRHGLDHARFKRLDGNYVQQRLSELGLAQPYLLFLSTVQPRKNAGRLVSAFEALCLDGLTLVIAGRDGWLHESIDQRIRTSLRSGSIKRMGYVADEDVPVLYNGAAAFVLPSLYEGFGMGVLEAMACGCPVVTSARSSLPEVAGGAVILVDPESVESIRHGIALVLDPGQSQRLRHAGLKRAADFSWSRAAVETLETIRRAYAETR
jgi:glycosyltransferase involved in cell wall biosynthesis